MKAANASEERAEFALDRLTDDALSVVAHHLTELEGALVDASEPLRVLRAGPPSKNLLETVLIQLEVDLQHGLYHWRHLVAILRQHDLWMEEDLKLPVDEGPIEELQEPG